MWKFIKNIMKVSMSNFMSLLSGVLVGFIVPKMLGLEGYANFKIYTLYLTYIALLSLGLGDGLYLKFSGTNKEDLDKGTISYYLKIYYVQIVLFTVIALFWSCFGVPKEYRFILVALSLTIFSSQITAVYQNLSLITSSFNEYSIRVIVKSVLTSLFVILLFLVSRITGKIISYKIYISGVVLIDYILACWYFYTYREFIFVKSKNIAKMVGKYTVILKVGFPLLLSNMAGSIFLNLDRQFVSLLFDKNAYAIYAFAYNLLTLITTMTSAVSLVLFPSLRRKKDLNIARSLELYLGPFNMMVAFFLIVYYPLSWFVPYFLPDYKLSLEIFRVVLPGLVISSSVSVILINFYKLENQIKLYFIVTLLSMLISIIANYVAYSIFNTYLSISWASIFTLFVWYLLTLSYFWRKYRINFVKTTIYMILMCILFYCITYEMGCSLIGGISFLGGYIILSFIFMKKNIRELLSDR